MSNPVGYLVNYPGGISGERGLYYDYIMASNGVFIEVESPLITARIPVAECEIRGLAPIGTKISLLYGSIPQRFFDLALNLFLTDISSEHYVAIVGDRGYHFYIPVQDKSADGVVYEVGTSVVLEMHSHGQMRARFSPTDNTDETGLKLYGVIGSLDAVPVVKFRIGAYGYFKTLRWSDVFDGSLAGAVEYEEVREEVIPKDGIQDFVEAHAYELKDPSRRMWWHRKFRC